MIARKIRPHFGSFILSEMKNMEDRYMRCRIGIDRMTLYKIDVESYNMRILLEKKKKVEVSTRYRDNTDFYLWDLDSDKVVTKIHIKDNVYFSDLIIGANGGENHCGIYVYLQLSVALATGGHNLIPYSYRQYRTYLEETIKYIEEEYSIKLDVRECCVKEIELNATLRLKNDFTRYDRVWRFLLPLIAPRLRKMTEYKENIKGKKKESYMLSGHEYAVVIYDKKKQLLDTYRNLDIEEQSIARLEFKMGTKKCEKVFGTKRWDCLSDDKILSFFSKEIEKVESKVKKWRTIREKDLRKKFLEYKEIYKKSYHHILLHWIRDCEIKNDIPYILDVSQIYDMLRNTKEPVTIQHNLKRIIGYFQKGLVEGDSLDDGDLEKLEEVLSVIKEVLYDRK